MMKSKWKKLGMTAGLALTLVAAGCGNDDSSEGGSSESVSAAVDYTITGIESGSGVVGASEDAVETYDSLEGWTVEPSSSGAMATALGEAIDSEDPIVVTGWTPHWMFAKYDLKYLEDPEGVFGEEEAIHSMARQGLEEDMPGVYTVLDQFNWEVSDMEDIMLEVSNGTDPAEAAQAWVDDNADKVAEWTDGAEEGDGQDVELSYVEWDSEVASTNVVKVVLDELGYNTTITPLDNAVMWQSVAQGETDGMVAAWLPLTHGDLYEQYQDQVVDLGENLEGAKTGLVVPSYVEADSIEDLEPAE